ncbi:tripartite tricarboxylate transporter substrate binding protein [Limibaculum sp. M0105]|uniref:Tripartite tricarboxylate transporter substrate binding protein n=1 Tax=Thermohalobaculum xanthum TaxID=2753746 RepID=A0A8J7M4T3_9RHOB|nr:tripartite tricarboxylate transporter substrate-binding protein [Thermohalobaculum xanthum]MBK0398309.1 tripartite tricarboxylate transporter substrate binding protein [Thermohalobaculum xanthum]
MSFKTAFPGALGAIAIIITAFAGAAAAADLDRLHFLIPGGNGGGWDTTARAVGEALTSAGIVGSASYENLSGRGGGKAIAHLVETGPGGDDILMVNSTPIVIRSLQGVFPHDFRDLTPVASIIGDYAALVTRAGSPIMSFADFKAAYDADPQTLAMGGGSVAGGMDHLVAALILREAGSDATKLRYVPYDAGGEAMTGLLGNEVDVLSTGFSEAAAMTLAGKVNLLCVTAPARLPDHPDHPTCAEAGANAVFINWRGFFAAPGLPADRRDAYVSALERMLGTPEWEAIRSRYGWVELFKTGDDFKAFLLVQEKQIGQLMQMLGFI